MKEETNSVETDPPKAKEKPLTPKYVLGIGQARDLKIPLYDSKPKLYRELNKAGYFWSEDGQAWQKQAPEPEKSDNPQDDSRISIEKKGIFINGKNGWYQVANFGLKLLYQISDQNDNITWKAAILHDDHEIPVELTNEELATPVRFHAALLKKGFVFKGDKYELNLIKELLIPSAKPAENVSVLGHHARSGVFVFGNGIYNERFTPPNDLGIVEHEDTAFFLPFANKLHMSRYKNAARFVYIPGKTTFDEWAGVYANAHLRQGLFPVLFKIAALFRDIPVKRLNFFPLLYLKGPPGTGKSRMLQGLTALDGYPQGGFNLKAKNTIKSLPRTLAQFSNTAIWFDEWYEGLDDGTKGTLQAGYDNSGYTRSEMTMGTETNTVDIFSAIMLTSNYLPMDEVFVGRCIIINIPSAKKTEAQTTAFDQLTNLENAGLSCVLGELLGSRELICKKWLKVYEETYEYFRKKCSELDTRTMKNMACLLTPAIILERAGKIHLKKAFQGQFDNFDLREIGRTQALLQQNYMSGNSDLNAFFTVLNNLVEYGKLEEGLDFRIKSKDGKLRLVLRMGTIYPQYLKEHRNLYDKVGLQRQELESLLRAHPAFWQNVKARFGKGIERDLSVFHNQIGLSYEEIQNQFDVHL